MSIPSEKKISDGGSEPGTASLPVVLEEFLPCLVESYGRWTGESLLPVSAESPDLAGALWRLERVLVAHDTRPDPVFVYGNRMALSVFEMEFKDFTRLPSRCSAEPMHQGDRARLLADVARQGFTRGYSGIRISASGKRFRIEEATLWNVVRPDGTLLGQAACFLHFQHCF